MDEIRPNEPQKWGLMLLDLILVILLGLFLPQIAGFISNQIFVFGSIPWLFSHHILQMIFALIVIILPVWKKPIKEWGFNLDNSKWSIRVFFKFIVGWIIILPIATLITQVLSGWPSILDFPATWKNFFQNLIFSSTMPGLSEEILFRGMIIGILSRRWKGKIVYKTFELSHRNLIASFIFAAAHIGFSLNPFRIVYFNIIQILFCLGLGIFYGIMLEKSKSLLGPILSHNASDAIGISIYFIITILFKM